MLHATTLTLSTVFHSKPRCHANMVTLNTPTCSTSSERSFLTVSPNDCVRFDLESCNFMCTYTVITHPCHIPPLAQARPMMLCIYTSRVNHPYSAPAIIGRSYTETKPCRYPVMPWKGRWSPLLLATEKCSPSVNPRFR